MRAEPWPSAAPRLGAFSGILAPFLRRVIGSSAAIVRPFGSLALPVDEGRPPRSRPVKKLARSLDESTCNVFTRDQVTHRGGQSPYAAKVGTWSSPGCAIRHALVLNQMRVSVQKHL